MNRRVIILLLAWLHPCLAMAGLLPASTSLAPTSLAPTPLTPTPLAATASGNDLCRRAIAAAERTYNIPSHLLASIARVESGRRDQATDTYKPWPWTINADGAGSFYDSKPQAMAAAAALRTRVARSIDVGCMQISLTYHPDAFASLEQAFDPVANVDYGARFLLQLFERTGSWPKAVAAYHSATPDVGEEYREKVYAALPSEQQMMGAMPAAASPLAAAWAATVAHPPLFGGMRPVYAHMIPLANGPAGSAVPGRDLASYRATAVRFAARMP